jgi:hypothetical protein
VNTARHTQVQLHHQAASLALHQLRRSPRLLITRSHGLYVNLAVRRDYSSPSCTGSTSPTPCTATTRHPDCIASATRLGALARRVARHAARRATRSRLLCLAQARRRLLRLRRASGCLGTSLGSSRGLSRRSSSTSPPRAGSVSTTSPTPRVRVPRHLARLFTRLVALLVVDYSASRRLVVNYFAYAARPGASARRAARHTACRAARRQLLRLAHARRQLLRQCRASGCLGTSRGSSCRS